MDRTGSRRGASNLTIPLMVLSFLVMGGFIWWLYLQATPTEVETAEADTVAAAPTGPVATEVPASELVTGAAQYEGQLIRLRGMEVMSRLGPQGVWVQLPNRNPFLVRLARPDTTLAAGGSVDLVGTVRTMNDSIVSSWVASGSITENQELEAGFASEFLDAEQVTPAQRAAGGGAGGG